MNAFPTLRILILVLLSGVTALGHGSMLEPLSRVYRVFLENPENPTSAAGRAAVAVAGTQAFYDWHEVNRLAPDHDYQRLIPDGQLGSAGRAKYAGLDLVRGDWPKTRVNRGAYHMILDAPTPHDPSYFQTYITRAGWNPLQPLRWADLEVLPGADQVRRDGNRYLFDTVLPSRTGHHVIYVIWQRIDPAGEAFFSLSDVDFGDGSGSGNPGAGSGGASGGTGSTNTPPASGGSTSAAPLKVEYREDSRWNDGFTATIRLINTGTNLAQGWTLSFRLTQGKVVNYWSAVSRGVSGPTNSFGPATWNDRIAPGSSVTFGFQVAAPLTVKPVAYVVNGKSITVTDCGPAMPSPSAGPISSSLVVKATQNWGAGFTAAAALKNQSIQNLNGWTLVFDFPHTITQLWDAEMVSRVGTRYTIRNAPWNRTLKGGSALNFGFNAEPGGVITQPVSVTLK